MTLRWLIDFHAALSEDDRFFPNNFFNKLARNDALMAQIKMGLEEHEIRTTCQQDLKEFRVVRERYRLYQ